MSGGESFDYIQAAVLGAIQGITEFLPISSTAHLRIVPELLGWPDPGVAASAVIQLGTVFAILIYFSRDLARLFANAARGGAGGKDSLRLLAGIAIGSVPIVVTGLLLEKWIDNEFRSLWVISASLVIFAILLAIADRIAFRAKRPLESVSIADALFVGIAQTFALVPGASRSGTTMTGAFFLGIERGAAARYSFLLSIPAITGAGLYKFWKERAVLSGPGIGPLAVATATAAIVGYLSLDFLLKYLKTRSAAPFVLYRLGLAALLVILLLTGTIKA
ncbi:MAG: undecaprenyl-diphosphatase UppP [Planctomycetota bacterium]